MVVSVSGTAGSGKSTAARRAADILRHRGYDVDLLRFQSLPCFRILRTTLKPQVRPSAADEETSDEPSTTTIRWAGYSRRRLGLVAVVLYLARVLAFRVYRLGWWSRDRVYVLNRYFYDSLAHYHLDSNVERFWLRLLCVAIPAPDLAIVIAADADALAARRPDYAPEYLADAGASYAKVRSRLPALVELRNDGSIEALVERLERLLPPELRSTGERPS